MKELIGRILVLFSPLLRCYSNTFSTPSFMVVATNFYLENGSFIDVYFIYQKTADIFSGNKRDIFDIYYVIHQFLFLFVNKYLKRYNFNYS